MEFILFILCIFLLLKNEGSSYVGRVFTNPDNDNELPPVSD